VPPVYLIIRFVKATRVYQDKDAWVFVLVVFVISRLFFFGVGAAADALLPRMPAEVSDHREPVGFFELWARWDGGWYMEIASHGYRLDNPDATNFFPLFPLLIRSGTLLGGSPALWGVLLSLIACFFAFFFLYQIANDLWGEHTARATTLCFAFFPTAFFLNAVYTEALFVALSAGSFWAARVRQNLLLAAVLGALAATTRNLGVLLLIPLASEWLRNRREFGWRGLWLGLVPVGLLAYTVFLWSRFGDPFIIAERQTSTWGRQLQNPLTTLETAWREAGAGLKQVLDPVPLFLDQTLEPSIAAAAAINFALFVLSCLLLAAGVPLLRKGLWAYTLLLVLIPVLFTSPSNVLISTSRYELAAFPIFFVLGWILSRAPLRRYTLWFWLLISGAIGAAEVALFVTGRWVL
jgi:hypothetical protein